MNTRRRMDAPRARMEGRDLLQLEPEERAAEGVFLILDGQEEVPRYTWAGAMDDTVEIELELLED